MDDVAGVRSLLDERVDVVDFDLARADVYPFVERKTVLDVWSRTYFHAVVADFIARAEQIGR